MADKRFHLGWFTTFGTTAWNDPLAGGEEPWDGAFYVEMAQALERACFDYIMMEDTLSVPHIYGGSADYYLRQGIMAPKHDPAPLVALMGAGTKHLGIVTTLSTMAYPPFMLARLCTTLDHICHGRFGWNIVSTAENAAALNFGLTELPPRAARYDMADEYVALVTKLFESWAPDAVVRDAATNTYVDPSKVQAVDFEGKYFRCKGPLNTVRAPQGRPAYVQAGGSPRGRTFAAQHADSIIATANGVAGMKAYRDDVRAKAAAAGRNPDDIKVLFLVSPVIGETEAVARERYEREINDTDFIERSLALFASFTEVDFSRYNLDEPLPPLTTNAEQGALDKFTQPGSGKTLRQMVREGGGSASIELVGTPDSVAEKMGEVIEEVGGDGFLITPPFHRISRRIICDITDGLVPALQRRGLVRSAYTAGTLRETLKEF